MISLAVLEINFYSNTPSYNDIENMATENVRSASQSFEKFITDFKKRSLHLGKEVSPLLNKNSSPEQVYNLISNEKDFWGVLLSDSSEAIAWTGFRVLKNDSLTNRDSISINVFNIQNVLSLHSTQILKDDNGNEYTLTTAKKL